MRIIRAHQAYHDLMAANKEEREEQIYVRRLKNHPLFDTEMTRITSYSPMSGVETLRKFNIKVVLKEPVTLEYE